MTSGVADGEITVPSGTSLVGRLTSGPGLAGFAARVAASIAKGSGGPWKIGSTVLVAAYPHVREVFSRDLDFRIAPINEARIRDVDDSFVLGMDRGAILAEEREALYTALAAVDLAPMRDAVAADARQRVATAPRIDVVGGYARPIAARTAQTLFGITGPDDATFMAVSRSIFCHTFLNLSGDPAVRQRAINAAKLLAKGLTDEIARRAAAGTPGTDMMGRLMTQGQLDHDGVRRTLAGMLVGSVDTTASSVAKIIWVIGQDKALARSVEADVDDLDRIAGWCWEALRRWPHNPAVLREAHAATTLGGVEIAAGDRIFVWTQAAMQDASAFPDPGRLRPDRPPCAYLHFGAELHACAGRCVNAFQIPLLVATLVRRGIASTGRVAWAGPFPDHLNVNFVP
jgi:cytochrome P450